jgi:hypothetical protein
MRSWIDIISRACLHGLLMVSVHGHVEHSQIAVEGTMNDELWALVASAIGLLRWRGSGRYSGTRRCVGRRMSRPTYASTAPRSQSCR